MKNRVYNLERPTDRYNYGLELLRTLMCFEVVLCHFWDTSNSSSILLIFNILRNYAVPVFMFMSFYLMQKNFVKKDKNYAFNRIWKLILPQIVWSVVYFIIYFVFGLILNVKLVNGIQDLFWQIFTGHSPVLNETMWFQTNIIIISIIFFAFFYFFNEKKALIMIVVLSLICIFLQYSEINYNLFSTLRYEVKYSFGRLAETFPIATLGVVVSRYNLITLVKKSNWINLLIWGGLTLLFISLERTYLSVSSDFNYAGIGKLLVGYTLVAFAYNCKFDWFIIKFPKLSRLITKHTLGIYCGHRLIAFLFLNVLSTLFGISKGMFYQCVLIYIIGLVLFEIISKLPFKWVKYIC